MAEREVVIFTDGGADPNPGIGGWAAILQYGKHEKVFTGNELNTTNNQMELRAAIAALEALTRPSKVRMVTDSQYLQRGITSWIEKWQSSGWQRKGKPIPNVNLWRKLWELSQKHDINWQWVRGHAGNPQNERVDQLARDARLAVTPRSYPSEDHPRLYVRGACRGNPGPGGWAVVVEDRDGTEQLSGGVEKTTNNRMELMAALEGLNLIPVDSPLTIVTTSDYLYQGITKWIVGWRKNNWQKKGGETVANADLWQRLDKQARQRSIFWVNAKNGNDAFRQGLEEASRLAREALQLI